MPSTSPTASHECNQEQEQQLHTFAEGIAAFKIDTNHVALHTQFGESVLSLTTIPGIRGLAVDSQNLVVWSDSDEIQVFSIRSDGAELKSHFAFEGATGIALYQDKLFVAQGKDLHVGELDGTQISTIRYDQDIASLSVDSSFLVVATAEKEIHVLDVCGDEPCVVGNPGRVKAKGNITALGCNADGTLVSIQIHKQGDASPSIFLFDSNTGMSKRIAATPPGTLLITHSWDPAEPRIMVCEYKPTRTSADKSEDGGVHEGEGFVVLFVTDDSAVIIADVIAKTDLCGTLLGIDLPRVYSAEGQEDATDHNDIVVNSTVMNSFRGLEEEGSSTLSALVQFALFIAVGDLESAYISVSLVKKPSVWETLCKMCISKRSLVMTEKCLSHLGHKRAIEAVEEARSTNPKQEEGVILAAIAIELGVIDEAELLYREIGRCDLLISLLQSQERWEEALEEAAVHDDIDVKSIHYNYAQHLEQSDDNESLAIHHYMRSGNVKPYLERLVEAGRLKDVEDIVVTSKDLNLLSWLAQKLETSSQLEAAKEFYQMAGDDLGLARVALNEADVATAVILAEQSSNASVSSLVGKHLEEQGDHSRALSLYAKSGAFDHAMRVAKSHGLSSDLVEIFASNGNATQCQEMIACAEWLEDRGDMGQAARLYHLSGAKRKSLELCLRETASNANAAPDSELAGVFASLVDELDAASLSDKDVFTYTRQFIALGDGEKAFSFLSKVRGDHVEMFASFATLCQELAQHRLASKFYAKAGDKLSSLRCLTLTKETKSVIAFAKAARMKEGFEMASEYLQTQNEQYLSTIIHFLSKARSIAKLIQVYESLARIAIDESRDYENAMKLLTKATEYLEQCEDIGQRSKLRRRLEQKIYTLTRFLQASNIVENDTSPMERFCNDLLLDNNKECIVPVEHGVKILVSQFVKVRRYHDAHDLCQSMPQPTKYIDRQVMEQIWAAVGKDPRDIQCMLDDDNFSSSSSSTDSHLTSMFEQDDEIRMTDEERTLCSEYLSIK